MEGIPQRSLAGSPMYLALCTRPDLAIGVSTLSRKIHGWYIGRQPNGCFGMLRVVMGMGCSIVRVKMWSYGDIAMPGMAVIKRLRGGALNL